MKITFLEVEKEDRKKIKQKFPQAQIISGVLSEKEIIKKCRETEILCIFIYNKISEKVINNLTNLKLITHLT